MVEWADYTDSSQYLTLAYLSLGDYVFQRAYDDVHVSSLQGDNGFTYHDIEQGILGDCYYLSSLASAQETNSWFSDNMIITENLNEEGIYAV